MINLYELATKNEEYLNDKLEYLKVNSTIDEKIIINDFQQHINSKKKASINMGIETLYKVIKDGAYKNIFESKKSREDISEKYEDDFEKLNIFVEEVQHGKIIKYAALNMGNSGLKTFGELCIY